MKTNKQFIAETLFSLRENPEFTVGENYESLRWHSQDVEKPTKEEFEARLELLKKEEPMRLLREKRDQILSQSDWRDLPSYPGSNQESWRTYRQQLRDLPSTTDPSNPTWPTAPEND